MTLPGTTAAQIGTFTAIWYLAWFLFEIPSGYFSDKFGHKNTMIIAKIFMLLSTVMFLLWYSFLFFALGAIFLSLATSFSSWTNTAFMHETFSELWKEKEFTKIMWKIKWEVSLISLVLIISLPFFTAIDIRMPLAINLWFDIIWLLIAFILVTPRKEKEIGPSKNIIQLIKETRGQKFYPVAIFSAIILAFLFAENAFRTVYLTSIGYPIIYIWFVMWISRFFWFLTGRYIHVIEKYFTIKQLLFAEIFIFSFYYISASLLTNPYVIWFIFSMIIGYQWGRLSIIDKHLIDSLKDKKYKATMLSIKSQIASMIQIVLAVAIWFVMAYSYQLWYGVLGVLIFVALCINYRYVVKSLEENKETKLRK